MSRGGLGGVRTNDEKGKKRGIEKADEEEK